MITAKSLFDKAIEALDGAIGQVKDLYFDDQSWRIRYLTVSTGTWLPGQTVMIAPESVTDGWHGETGLQVNLTREQVQNSEEQHDAALHVRSVHEVIGCRLRATDGEAGHIDDLVLDDEHGGIRFLVVDTETFLTGKKVLLPPSSVELLNLADRLIIADMSAHAVENSPEYERSE